ncbi:MAG: polyketide cyclase [Rikenellaceae bacterium]
MTEYTSKQVQLLKPDFLVFEALSSFSNFTPMIGDKVENWEASVDKCSFKAQGFTVKLQMIERTPNSVIKITGDDLPLEFFFWVQLKKVADCDTRLRLVVKAELNFMMKTMIGSKLQKGLDQMAESIATAFNQI